MGLFDVFKKKDAPSKREESRVAIEAPATIEVQAGAGIVCAPVTGTLVAMSEVPDPVFSSEVLGRGCAVWPASDVVRAPVSGEVTVTMGHAAGIRSDDGIEVLVHVGIDTVNLEGKGFTGYVAVGDRVVAGQPLLAMDRAAIAAAGYKDCVIVAVSNSAAFSSVELAADANAEIQAGAAALRVAR